MMQVWFFFKILETAFGTLCMVYHAEGFLDKEPLPHILLFCGTFFGFTLLSFMGLLGIAVGGSPPPLVECATNFCATIMYVMASVVSMHYAENDFHLMYLSDFEEPLHPYFANCRAQSIAALATGSIHLLHSILAFDVLFVPKRASMESRGSDSDEEDEEETFSDERRPIKMYFLSKFVESKLRKNEWFDNMCRRPSAPLTIYSIMPISSRRASNIHGMANLSDMEKNRPAEKTYGQEYKSSPATDAKRANQESVTSEEIKDALDYTDFASPPQLTPDYSKPFEIVNEKKDPPYTPYPSSSPSESKLTRFTLPSEKLTSESNLDVNAQSQQDQKLHSILKKDSEDSKAESPAQQSQPQRKIEPPAGASKTPLAGGTMSESKTEPESKPLSQVQRTSSQQDLRALLKGPPKKEEEPTKPPPQDTHPARSSSQEALFNLLKAPPPSSALKPKEQPPSTPSKEDLPKSESVASHQPTRSSSQEALRKLLQKPPEPKEEITPEPSPSTAHPHRTSSQEALHALLHPKRSSSQEALMKLLHSPPKSKEAIPVEPPPRRTSSQEALKRLLQSPSKSKEEIEVDQPPRRTSSQEELRKLLQGPPKPKEEIEIDPPPKRSSSQESLKRLLQGAPSSKEQIATESLSKRTSSQEALKRLLQSPPKSQEQIKTEPPPKRSSSEEALKKLLEGPPVPKTESKIEPPKQPPEISSQESIKKPLESPSEPKLEVRVEPSKQLPQIISQESLPESEKQPISPKVSDTEPTQQLPHTSSKEAAEDSTKSIEKPKIESTSLAIPLAKPPSIFSPESSKTSLQDETESIMEMKAEPSPQVPLTLPQEPPPAVIQPLTELKPESLQGDIKDEKTDQELVTPLPVTTEKVSKKKKVPKRDSSTQTTRVWPDEHYDESSMQSTDKDHESISTSAKDKTPSEDNNSKQKEAKKSSSSKPHKPKSHLSPVKSVDVATETESSDPPEMEFNRRPSMIPFKMDFDTAPSPQQPSLPQQTQPEIPTRMSPQPTPSEFQKPAPPKKSIEPTMPMLQPTMPMVQPTMPMLQPTMPMLQPTPPALQIPAPLPTQPTSTVPMPSMQAPYSTPTVQPGLSPQIRTEPQKPTPDESIPRKKHKSNEPTVDRSQQTPPEFDVSDPDLPQLASIDKQRCSGKICSTSSLYPITEAKQEPTDQYTEDESALPTTSQYQTATSSYIRQEEQDNKDKKDKSKTQQQQPQPPPPS